MVSQPRVLATDVPPNFNTTKSVPGMAAQKSFVEYYKQDQYTTQTAVCLQERWGEKITNQIMFVQAAAALHYLLFMLLVCGPIAGRAAGGGSRTDGRRWVLCYVHSAPECPAKETSIECILLWSTTLIF